MQTPGIEVDNLSRTFDGGGQSVTALDSVSFAVEQGASVSLLGKNGAGKTTLAKILATLLIPTGGHARVAGHDVVRDTARARRNLSVVFGGDRGLYALLSARENLRYFGMLGGVSSAELRRRIPGALEEVGLAEHADRRVEEFSRGMRQRLHIAIGLISRPRILVLDEPTVGLDPIEAERLREHVRRLREREVTLLLTSHLLLDVERLSDRVLMIDRGRLTHDLSVRDFARATGYAAIATVVIDGPAPAVDAAEWSRASLEPAGTTTSGDTTTLVVRVPEWSSRVLEDLGRLLAGSRVLDIDIRNSTLEDAFAVMARAGQV